MDDNYYEMIFKRKSFHLFNKNDCQNINIGEITEITEKFNQLTPLNKDIKTEIRIVKSDETTCKRNEEYCILFYSEKKDNYLQNIGYLGEQLDLYLVSKNIGTLWFGIGKPQDLIYKDLDFVIMIAISKINDILKFRKDMFKSKRKPLEEIWNGQIINGVTDIVRFCPSACNTQPWIINYSENVIKIYRYKKPGKRGIMPTQKVVYYNKIDIGIFLCFMDICLKHNNIKYNRDVYIDNNDNELTLQAVYIIQD